MAGIGEDQERGEAPGEPMAGFGEHQGRGGAPDGAQVAPAAVPHTEDEQGSINQLAGDLCKKTPTGEPMADFGEDQGRGEASDGAQVAPADLLLQTPTGEPMAAFREDQGRGEAHEGIQIAPAAVPPGPPTGDEQDLLNQLPDDLLLRILELVGLDGCAAAARASLVCRRWRGFWGMLQRLRLVCTDPGCRPARAALTARAALGGLNLLWLEVVCSREAAPDAIEELLLLAAHQVSGELHLSKKSSYSLDLSADLEHAQLDFPVFARASKISLSLSYLGISLVTGQFGGLRSLSLDLVRFYGLLSVADTMFPCLRELRIRRARGLIQLDVRVKNLYSLTLSYLVDLEQIEVVSSFLRNLFIFHSMCWNVQRAVFKVENLERLKWRDGFGERQFVQFSRIPHLYLLAVDMISLYGDEAALSINRLGILRKFYKMEETSIDHLVLVMAIASDLNDSMMPNFSIPLLPQVGNLSIELESQGHKFSDATFYLVSRCPQLKMLKLTVSKNSEKENACTSNCLCSRSKTRQEPNFQLKNLTDVELAFIAGEKVELILVEQLLLTAPALERLQISCGESVASCEVLQNDVQSFAGSKVAVKISRA